MPLYFSMADALLVTLKRDMIFEHTIPSKIQSYLACGKPILGALDGDIDSIDLTHSVDESLVGVADGHVRHSQPSVAAFQRAAQVEEGVEHAGEERDSEDNGNQDRDELALLAPDIATSLQVEGLHQVTSVGSTGFSLVWWPTTSRQTPFRS